MTVSMGGPETVYRPALGWAPDWWAAGLNAAERRAAAAPASSRPIRPAWADFVEAALAAGHPQRYTPDADRSPEGGFAAVVEPFVEESCHRLPDTAGFDLPSIRRHFAERLTQSLVRVAARTLILELNVRRVTNRLAGSTPQERFAAFTHGLDRAALLSEYAVLGRLIGQSCLQAIEAHAELMRRFAADRDAIVAGLLGGADPGAAVEVDVRGDAHRGGRAVSLVRFANDCRVVYKPRPVGIHARFNVMVRWLDRATTPPLSLRTLSVLVRDGYGWVEFAEHRPCATPEDVATFYWRLGALMALLHVVSGTDVHYENVIACADQPVLVDVETLLQPSLPGPAGLGDDPALAALSSSVSRLALLPQLVIGEYGALDVSGFGGGTGGTSPFEQVCFDGAGTDQMRLVRRPRTLPSAQNRPRLEAAGVDPTGYGNDVLAGFRTGYEAIARNREVLIDMLSSCADDEIRVVLRPTRSSAILLDESTHPDLMRDGPDRDRVLGTLWADTANDPAHEPLVRHEIADLWAGDIPLLTGRPGAPVLSTGDGQRLPTPLVEPGLDRAIRLARGLGRRDLDRQEWLIRATMAAQAQPDVHPTPERARDTTRRAAPAGLSGTRLPDPERLLSAARTIADRLTSRAFTNHTRVNWWGLEALDGRYWTVRPLGAELSHGYAGVALFLAEVAHLTGEARYAELARQALRATPLVLDRLAVESGAAALVGCGGFDGLGGIAYALARLAILLDDAELASWATGAVGLLATAIDDSQSYGVADGAAGGLAALLAVHRMTGLPAAWQAAQRCAGRLSAADRPLSPVSGFAHGEAGIGWALLRYRTAGGGDRSQRAGVTAFHHVRREAAADPGWCRGAAGLVMAYATSARPAALAGTVASLLAYGPVASHGLCHGELGMLEALTVATRGQPGAATALTGRADRLIRVIERDGPRCDTPGGVESPGLLTGLAGIGYGLLRMASPDRVPSVLLLEPEVPAIEKGETHD